MQNINEVVESIKEVAVGYDIKDLECDYHHECDIACESVIKNLEELRKQKGNTVIDYTIFMVSQIDTLDEIIEFAQKKGCPQPTKAKTPISK